MCKVLMNVSFTVALKNVEGRVKIHTTMENF